MKGDRRQSPTKRGGENTRRGLPPGESRKYLFIGVTKTEHHAVKTYCAALGLEYNAWVRGLIFAAIDEGTIREARAQIHRNKPNGEPGEALPRMAAAGIGISDVLESGATTMRDDYLAQPRSGPISDGGEAARQDADALGMTDHPNDQPIDPETEF